MPKSTAMSQLVLLLVFYIAPFLAATPAGVPLCCRKDGAHHCEMADRFRDANTTLQGSTHCPYRFPSVLLTCGNQFLPSAASSSAGEFSARRFRLDVRRGIALLQPSSSLESRGPPALSF